MRQLAPRAAPLDRHEKKNNSPETICDEHVSGELFFFKGRPVHSPFLFI